MCCVLALVMFFTGVELNILFYSSGNSGETDNNSIIMDAVEGNSSTPLLSPGFVIRERWEVVKKIGGGGFGEIYKARDHETNMVSNYFIPVEAVS